MNTYKVNVFGIDEDICFGTVEVTRELHRVLHQQVLLPLSRVKELVQQANLKISLLDGYENELVYLMMA